MNVLSMKLLTLGMSSLDIREDCSETVAVELRTESWVDSSTDDVNLEMGVVLQGECV